MGAEATALLNAKCSGHTRHTKPDECTVSVSASPCIEARLIIGVAVKEPQRSIDQHARGTA